MTGLPADGPVVHPDPADGHGDSNLMRALQGFAPGHREIVADLIARLAGARSDETGQCEVEGSAGAG
jgi:hypothetical protein